MDKLNTSSIYFSINFITNFKPQLITDFKNYEFFGNKNQIYCRNFFIYVLLLKHKNSYFNKSNIYVKKTKKKVYTILRSPYRHKLARHQISLNRYIINLSIKIDIKSPVKFNNTFNLLKFLMYIKNFNKLLDSNLIFTNSIFVSLPFFYKNNFIMRKYK